MQAFVDKTRRLLAMERDAETDETQRLLERCSPKELQRRGVCLLNLRVGSRRTGLYGRSVVTFEPARPGRDLPAHRLTPGDIVGVFPAREEASAQPTASGVVCAVAGGNVGVAFERAGDADADIADGDDNARYRLAKLANDVTYRRLCAGLDRLETGLAGPPGRLADVLFGEADPSPPAPPRDVSFFDSRLDESQREAVRFALLQPEVAIVHGPPGTGKTTTVVEIVLQAVAAGDRVLACAPSNVAVDNLVERLASPLGGAACRIVRLGHPARLLPAVQRHSLDAVVRRGDAAAIVADVRADAERAAAAARGTRDAGARQRLRREARTLRAELRRREEAATRDALARADVVLATLTTATRDGPLRHLADDFDACVIDECGQATEAACWIALPRARRCVLAGDHLQLPPTVVSRAAAAAGLATSLMERVVAGRRGDTVTRMLTRQYRMHAAIALWPSLRLYDGRLVADPSVAAHLLRDLPGVDDTEDTGAPLLLVDTTGCDVREMEFPEEEEEEERSRGNEGEADLAAIHARALVAAGVAPRDIGVIAPYNLQVDLLRARLSADFPQMEVKSVDGFQGREKEAVVISLVRSNARGEVGFLSDRRRVNVAVTRARRHLAVICDAETVRRGDAFLAAMVDDLSARAVVRSAAQYAGEMERAAEATPRRAPREPTPRKTKGKTTTTTKKETKKKEKQATEKRGAATTTTREEGEAREEAAVTREEVAGVVERVRASPGGAAHEFSATLGPRERRLVHELAERAGLRHESHGEGETRRVRVWRTAEGEGRSSREQQRRDDAATERVPPASANGNERKRGSGVAGGDAATAEVAPPVWANGNERAQGNKGSVKVNVAKRAETPKQASAPAAAVDAKQQTRVEDKNENTTVAAAAAADAPGGAADGEKCERCGARIPANNRQLHDARCAKRAPPGGGKRRVAAATKGKRKDDKGHEKEEEQEEEEEDFDALVAAARRADSCCAAARCRAGVATLGQTCGLCVRIFCLSHHTPEAHGCGDAAKARARANIRKQGALYSGSGVPERRPDAERKAALQRKLGKKLSELSNERKMKKHEK